MNMRQIKTFILASQIIIVLMTMIFVSFIGYIHLQKSDVSSSWDGAPVIILTGDDGRIKAGLSLAKTLNSQAVLITGVNAKVDKSYIVNQWNATDIKDIISLDHQAKNTVGNIKQAKEWLDNIQSNQAIFVTSDYHTIRTKALVNSILKNHVFEIYSVPSKHLKPQQLRFWSVMSNEFYKTSFIKLCMLQRFISCME